MRRTIVVSFLWRVHATQSLGWSYPVEQRIHHHVEIVQLYAFYVEVLAQRPYENRVLDSAGRQQVQVKTTTLAAHLDIVTFVAHCPMQVCRGRLDRGIQCNLCTGGGHRLSGQNTVCSRR